MLMIVANEMKQRNERNFSVGVRLREESSYNSFIKKVRISINISGRKNILPFCYQREINFCSKAHLHHQVEIHVSIDMKL